MTKDNPPDKSELLNIKQAARLLNVSEVSLRRWTNSGRLACLRIGARRERRFRREDLLAYPERQDRMKRGNGPQSTAASTVDTNQGSNSNVQAYVSGIAIDYGSHLCSFYETDPGRVKLAVPFLADGLKVGDICFFIAADRARSHVLGALAAIYPALEEAQSTGQLKQLDGMASGRGLLDYFEQEFLSATSSGATRMRVLGDMAWFLEKGLGIDELNEFEMTYNHSLGHRFPVVSLCQYDARVFSGVGVLGALKTHDDTFRYPLSGFLGLDRQNVA